MGLEVLKMKGYVIFQNDHFFSRGPGQIILLVPVPYRPAGTSHMLGLSIAGRYSLTTHAKRFC